MMEDVQVSNSTSPLSRNISESRNEFINAEGTKIATDAPNPVEGDVMPVLELPETIVEVVIEKKVELEPEDSILPDHYHDDGNIPVFKPVF